MKQFFSWLFAALSVIQPVRADVRTCIKDICGGPEGFAEAAGGGALVTSVPADVLELVDGKLIPLMKKIGQEDREILKLNFQTLDSADIAQLSERYPHYVGFLGLYANFRVQDIQAAIKSRPHNMISIDVDKLKSTLPFGAPENYAEKFAWVLELILKSSHMATTIHRAPYDALWSMLSIDRARIAGEANSYLWFMDHSLLSVYPSGDLNRVAMEKLSRGQPLKEWEKKVVVSLISQLEIDRAHYDRSELGNMDFELSTQLKDLETKYGLQQIRFALGKNLSSLKESEVITSCSARIAAYVASSPSDSALKKFRQLEEQVLAAAREILPNYFSDGELLAARDALKAVSFYYPSSRAQVLSELEEYFAAAFSSARKLHREIITSTNRDVTLLKFLLRVQRNGWSNEILPKLSEACALVTPALPIDRAFPHSVIVSWQSVLWPENGAQILAHELGHLVSDSVAKMRRDRGFQSCEPQIHALVYGPKSHGEHSQNEDFADTFSISVSRKLMQTWPFVKNGFCKFPLPESALRFMSGNHDSLDRELDLTNDLARTHSSIIFRLLRTQSELGQLPRSCETLWNVPRKCAR